MASYMYMCKQSVVCTYCCIRGESWWPRGGGSSASDPAAEEAVEVGMTEVKVVEFGTIEVETVGVGMIEVDIKIQIIVRMQNIIKIENYFRA